MKTVDEIMEQAQLFASTWALINSRFDNGDLLSIANDAKVELRVMVEAALSKQAAHVAELEAALRGAREAIRKEISEEWECTSYHPSLTKAVFTIDKLLKD